MFFNNRGHTYPALVYNPPLIFETFLIKQWIKAAYVFIFGRLRVGPYDHEAPNTKRLRVPYDQKTNNDAINIPYGEFFICGVSVS